MDSLVWGAISAIVWMGAFYLLGSNHYSSALLTALVGLALFAAALQNRFENRE